MRQRNNHSPTSGTTLLGVVALGLLIGLSLWGRHDRMDGQTSQIVKAQEPTPTPTEPPIASASQAQEIEDYIRTIFGKDGRMAIAVAKGECRGLRPTCRNVTSREHSVCHFQINLKAHADKVPGDTLEEKERWLTQDHRHCTLIAKVIFDASYWRPWSAFKNGSYKKYL